MCYMTTGVYYGEKKRFLYKNVLMTPMDSSGHNFFHTKNQLFYHIVEFVIQEMGYPLDSPSSDFSKQLFFNRILEMLVIWSHTGQLVTQPSRHQQGIPLVEICFCFQLLCGFGSFLGSCVCSFLSVEQNLNCSELFVFVFNDEIGY